MFTTAMRSLRAWANAAARCGVQTRTAAGPPGSPAAGGGSPHVPRGSTCSSCAVGSMTRTESRRRAINGLASVVPGGAYLCELDDGRAGGEEVYQTLWCGHPKHAPQPTQGREHARVTFRKGGISCIMCVVRHGPGYRLSACRSSSVFSEEVAWGLVNAELPRTLCPRRFPQRGWPPNFECNSRPGSCSLVLP